MIYFIINHFCHVMFRLARVAHLAPSHFLVIKFNTNDLAFFMVGVIVVVIFVVIVVVVVLVNH
jgi:hypothetical protein